MKRLIISVLFLGITTFSPEGEAGMAIDMGTVHSAKRMFSERCSGQKTITVEDYRFFIQCDIINFMGKERAIRFDISAGEVRGVMVSLDKEEYHRAIYELGIHFGHSYWEIHPVAPTVIFDQTALFGCENLEIGVSIDSDQHKWAHFYTNEIFNRISQKYEDHAAMREVMSGAFATIPKTEEVDLIGEMLSVIAGKSSN